MNRNSQKLRRLTALVAVLSALAIPCAGWGWDATVDGSSDAPAVFTG